MQKLHGKFGLQIGATQNCIETVTGLETAGTLVPGIIRAVHWWIGKGISDRASSEVIRRVLCNEMKFNLGLMNSVVPARSSSTSGVDAFLVGALVCQLDTAVSEAIFAGVEPQLIVLEDLNAEVAVILNEADPNDLAISRSITKATRVDFSTLLGYTIRKISEMKALSTIQREEGAASMPIIDWSKRIGNLRAVMLFLVSRLTDVP